jgi:hypothetical protein
LHIEVRSDAMTRKPRAASEQIIQEVTSWPGVRISRGDRFGELEIKLGRRELGHLHGERAAHFGFPKEIWNDLRGQGRIAPHPIFPDKAGLAARRIESDADVRDVIALLRLNYERAVARHGLPDEPAVHRSE